MKTKEIKNVHDKFFQETFTRREIAESFLKNYLPESLIPHINFETLTIIKDSFIDKELQEHFSDILYKVQFMKEGLYIYLLFEHKSYKEPLVAFQLLRYMVKIWDQYLKQNPRVKKLPAIFPMVLYHGKAEWKIPENFQAVIQKDAVSLLKEYIPEFNYRLYDISHVSDDEIKGEVTGRIVLLIFKYIFSPDLREKLPEIIRLFNDTANKKTGLEVLEVLLRYAVQTGRFEEGAIKKIFQESLKGEDVMKTFIDRYIEQGLQQGLQQGWRQILIRQIEARFGKVPGWAKKKIESADITAIEKWSIRLLKADTLKEVLADDNL